MCFKRKHTIDDYHKKLNKIDKLFIRIFLSSLLLFSLLIIDNVNLNICNKFIYSFNENINFIKYSKLFNGVFGNYVPINQNDTVNKEVYYDVVNYSNNTNIIQNYSFEGVCVAETGVVTKIKKNKNNLYNITIKTNDGTNYTYNNLITCDVRIYSYINLGDIIGSAMYDDEIECYTFNLIIEKEGKYYDYYQKS